MKRSSPPRRSPLPPRTKYLPRPTKPIRSKGGKRFPKGYDKAYRAYVSHLPCLLFGKPGHECGRSEPAHVHADATGAGDRGQLIPLCGNAHRLGPKNWHDTGRHSFCAYWRLGTFADLERLAQRTLDPEIVTLLWTDPPYGHSNHGDDLNSRLNAHRGLDDRPIANDTPDSMRSVLDGALAAAVRVLRADCCCCCCCGGGGGPRPTFAWVANRLDRDGLTFFHSVIWDKRNPGLGWRYRRQHEMVMVAHRTGGKLAWRDDGLAVPNVQSLAPPRDRLHPNEKPLDLPARFIAWHTAPADLVLDPFMGVGTTLVAAKALQRRAIGIELDERFCEIAATRLQQETLDLGGVA